MNANVIFLIVTGCLFLWVVVLTIIIAKLRKSLKKTLSINTQEHKILEKNQLHLNKGVERLTTTLSSISQSVQRIQVMFVQSIKPILATPISARMESALKDAESKTKGMSDQIKILTKELAASMSTIKQLRIKESQSRDSSAE